MYNNDVCPIHNHNNRHAGAWNYGIMYVHFFNIGRYYEI